jgi:ferric-chelate reductase
MKFSFLYFLALFASFAHAKSFTYYSEEYYAAYGCHLGSSNNANFCGKADGTKSTSCSCKNKYALATIANCAHEYFDNLNYKKVLENFVKICGSSNKNLTVASINDNYEDLKNKIVNLDDVKSFNKTSPNFPISGSQVEKQAKLGYISYKHRYSNLVTSNWLGVAFVAAVGFVMVCAGILNWLARLSRSYAVSKARTSTISNIFRKHLTLGLLGSHLQPTKYFGSINPDRVETFFIVIMYLYTILSICIIGYQYTPGDVVFASYQIGTSRYWGDRSCIILSYQLPLLFLFPGRNNFFQYITRWKYSRFITFHKWLARLVILEVLVHSFAMSSQTYALHKMTRFHAPWYQWGIVGTVFGCLAWALAISPIRRRFYEIFVAIHIIFVSGFLYSSWIHAESQNYQQFYWACIAVWCFDRFIRIVRIILFGGIKNVEIEYFQTEEILRLTVPGSKILKAQPGNHAFIHFLTFTRFLQSHPFTVYPSKTKSGYVHFNCCVKKGMTKYLAQKCLKAENNKISMKILVDGYYGETSYYQHYNKSVFITSGTGLSGPLFFATKLISNTITEEVNLYWCVRTYSAIKCYADELIGLKESKVKIIIYISQPENSYISTSSDDDDVDQEEKNQSLDLEDKDKTLAGLLSSFEIRHGRMSASEIIEQEIANSNGSLAIGACAHPEIVDEVRRKISRSLSIHDSRIEYFEEMQQW